MSLILLPFRLAVLALVTPLRVARLPLKLFGFRGTLALGLGVAVGVLVAPRPGSESRRLLRERWDEWQGYEPLTPPGGSETAPR